MLKSIVEFLGTLFERSDFADRFLYRGLDCCSAAGGRPWKRYGEYQEVKQVFSFVAELSVSDDRMIETGAHGNDNC